VPIRANDDGVHRETDGPEDLVGNDRNRASEETADKLPAPVGEFPETCGDRTLATINDEKNDRDFEEPGNGGRYRRSRDTHGGENRVFRR
jgi:hypothetical protein